MDELMLYRNLLLDIKQRIGEAQTRAVLAVNTELLQLYWDIGRIIAQRQEQEGWGAGIIPRLAIDLHNELPEMKGFSERNLKRMLAFYRAYPTLRAKVPQAVALLPDGEPGQELDVPSADEYLHWSIPWGHHALLMEKIKDVTDRLWYMRQTLEQGWSRNTLYAGKINFYCNVIDDHLRHASDQPTIGLILCQDKNAVVAEYALRGMNKPIGVSEYELTRALPEEFQSSLPSVEDLEAELSGSKTDATSIAGMFP